MSLLTSDYLRKWSVNLLTNRRVQEKQSIDVLKSGWLGYPGISLFEIHEAENRLHKKLPPSFENFLLLTNGWRYINSGHRLLHLHEIDWFGTRHPDWVKSFQSNYSTFVTHDEYYTYDDTQDPSNIRTEYLPKLLAISSVNNSSIFLLNPNVINSMEEWEAWFFANWLPGAVRYPSFEAMILAESIM